MLLPDGYGLLPLPETDPDSIRQFDCGKPHLNQYLNDFALSHHERRLSSTNVVFHRDFDGVVGYFTVCNDAIPLKDSERFGLGLADDEPLSSFPAVKICRLAVCQEIQGQGVGRQILDLLLGEIADAESLSAARLVVVDADNDDRVISFYENYGFNTSLWAEGRARNSPKKNQPATIKMWLDLLALKPD